MKKIISSLVLLATFIPVIADNWLARLPDDVYIATLSLPGAHDAATGNGLGRIFGFIDGDRYARTQDINLAAQWAIGVRAFDLRPCTTADGYLNVNHGIVPTDLRFDDALYLLRDSIKANPTEFAVIHLLHASEGDNGSHDYETLLHELLDSDDLKEYIADFHRDLTIGDLRGKILILYRDSYNTRPTGGLMTGWTGALDWNAQTAGRITGGGTGSMVTSPLYMQDYAETYAEGAIEAKVEGIQTMLDYSTTHTTGSRTQITWVFNLASAYSQVITIMGYEASLADGYRENATHTNAAIIDYLEAHDPGPTGIILADYIGVDASQGDDKETYDTMGETLVEALIENNFNYITSGIRSVNTQTADEQHASTLYDLQGRRVATPRPGVYIKGNRKVIIR